MILLKMMRGLINLLMFLFFVALWYAILTGV